MEIKFCRNNFTHGTNDVVAKLVDNYPEHKLVIETCIGHCDECVHGPFAIVNEKIVVAQTCEELYGKIEDRLQATIMK
jgi:uncharacterized protein YuzB (UPF0349 family)